MGESTTITTTTTSSSSNGNTININNTINTTTSIYSTSKGPLGPTWQPIYDGTYTILMQTFNLPHLALLTVIGLLYGQWYGHLSITPIMPFVSIFAMARVPFVGCCMSLCLHRYFAHNAFSTSRPVQFLLGIFGSMAIQGGILWWASKHLRHHKHCDMPNDPHSPTQTSEAYAWLGWLYCETHHDWVYLPKRLLTPELLLLNLFFFLPNALVTLALMPWLGTEWALFVCWVPGLFGALATTRFNVEYHPPVVVLEQQSNTSTTTTTTDNNKDKCIGVNKASGDKGIGPIRLEWLAVHCPWMFEPLVGEAFHKDHHEHPRRAHRPGYDMPYTLILRPLAYLGIIWDLQQPLPVDDWVDPTGKLFPIVAEKSA